MPKKKELVSEEFEKEEEKDEQFEPELPKDEESEYEEDLEVAGAVQEEESSEAWSDE